MTKEKAGASPANSNTSSRNYNDETGLPQALRILDYLANHGRLTTIDARRMGIMHPGMRVCELRKRGAPIETARTYQADETGAVHFVAVYLWRGQDARQADLFGGC